VPFGDWKPSAPGLAAQGLDAVRRNLVAAEMGVNSLALASGVKMIRVPSGPFIMGTNEQHLDEREDEKPRRTVTLNTYCLSKTPITVGQFRAYTRASDGRFDWDGRKPRWGWRDDHPMVRVTWHEAKAYCSWAGGDLPTEAQWERAARGTDGQKYPWGNEWNPDMCVHNSETLKRSRTEPVNRRANIFVTDLGHTDMAGNVSEWCLEHNQYGDCILRGSSWNQHLLSSFRSSYRSAADPRFEMSIVGFRLAGI